MTHPLSGATAVEDSARLVRNYRFAVERMMRILGGWIALTPELSAKLLMGRHVWDNAQHADALGRRLPELRAPAHVSAPANPAFVAFMDTLEEPEHPHQTVERVVGVYGVLKPHLLATYEAHLGQANEVYEPPTRRILERCATDERRHVAAGRIVLTHLIATPAHAERVHAWQARLEALLVASEGVTGRGFLPRRSRDPIPSSESLSDDGREFIRLEQSGTRWAIPEGLEPAVRMFGDAVIAQDPAAIRRVLSPGVTLGEEIQAALFYSASSSHRMVAFTKVGRQRLIKLRLDGPGGSVTVSSRWVPTETGWRAAALDLVRLHPIKSI